MRLATEHGLGERERATLWNQVLTEVMGDDPNQPNGDQCAELRMRLPEALKVTAGA